jgi:hypothetical protein
VDLSAADDVPVYLLSELDWKAYEVSLVLVALRPMSS